MPFLGPIFGAIGAGIGVTGAGVTAGMSIAAGVTATAVAAGVGMGIYSSQAANAAANKNLAGAQAAIPSVKETEVSALDTAKKDATARRRSILAGGGQTDITGGTATLTSNTGRMKTLVGQ